MEGDDYELTLGYSDFSSSDNSSLADMQSESQNNSLILEDISSDDDNEMATLSDINLAGDDLLRQDIAELLNEIIVEVENNLNGEDLNEIESLITIDECNTSDEDAVINSNDFEQMGGDFAPEQYYELSDPSVQRIKRFNTEGAEYKFRLINSQQIDNFDERLPTIFDHAVNKILTRSDPNALVGLQFFHANLDKPVLIHFRNRQNINGEIILKQIESILQSNQEIKIDSNDSIIKIVTVTPPVGSGRYKNRNHILHEKFLNRGNGGCFIQIKNKDKLCLARALVVARAHLHKDDPAYHWNSIRQGDHRGNKTQKVKAQELMELAGLENCKGPCGIPELLKLQEAMLDYRIKVFRKGDSNELFFDGSSRSDKILHLYLHDGHFTVISRITAFFSSIYFCESCNTPYKTRERHRCANKCSSCYYSPPCKKVKILTCSSCNRYFYNLKCFENHKRLFSSTPKKGKEKVETSICMRIQRCKKCGKHLRQAHKKKHKCGYFYCRTCKKDVLRKEHLCYMQKLLNEEEEEIEPNDENNKKHEKEEFVPRFVFFDFETTQERVIKDAAYGPELEHVPNLCVAHIVCDECSHKELSFCYRCGENRRIFQGESCLDEFCTFLFGLKHVVAIAHNCKGFDGQFILQFFFKQGKVPKIISKGLELMSISYGTVKVIDSFNFLPMKLANLPQTFGIEELCKGHFPHGFNKKENWNYIGEWPDPSYYYPTSMKPDEYTKFYEWYNQQKGKIFNFKEQILSYCESDVSILRLCCLRFRDLFMEETTVDPFEKSLTIASACNIVFRKLFLKPDTIGIVPADGYRRNEKQSQIAIKWLKWISVTQNRYINNKQNGYEIKIGKYRVDGFSDGTVFEFLGCFWHGCIKCMTKRYQLTADRMSTAKEAHDKLMERAKFINQAGYNLVEMWECDLAKELDSNPIMKKFFDTVVVDEPPMNPRQAFYGGRTNAIKLYHKIKRNTDGTPKQKINYIDICSLYPFINKYGKYPIGHPKILTENFENVTLNNQPYEGLIKCEILPPRKLFHPVLPFRCGGKLMFPLCQTCAMLQQKEECEHNDKQRMLKGAWVTLEIYKALSKGYRIIKIFEVWHYEQTEQYHPIDNPDGGLFAEYVNTFMKMKLEAEGYPSRVKTDEDKLDYIMDIDDRESIFLDASKIEKNKGKRAIAKLMLNSFWGKFGQRNNLTKTVYFKDPAKYFAHIFNPSIVVTAIHMISEELVSVTYKQHDDFVDVMSNTNPVIAAYTTAQARLKLYYYIEKLDKRVLYFDTDSIIYISNLDKPMEYTVPVGNCLGEMTNELREYGDGSYVSEFCSGGPKNYGFRVFSTNDKQNHFVHKVRGITLSYITVKRVNFKCLRRLVRLFVKYDNKDEISIVSTRIERKKEGRKVVTKYTPKKFRIVYDKRVIHKNFSTFPYGY